MSLVTLFLFGLMFCCMAIAVYRSPVRMLAVRHLFNVTVGGAIVGLLIGAVLFKGSPATKTLGLIGLLGAGFTASTRGIILGSPKTGLPAGKLRKENQ
jgi:hypothetical protein